MILAPEIVVNDFTTEPAGLSLVVAAAEEVTPFARPVTVGSTVALGAPTPQPLAGQDYFFVSWDDGGDAGRSFVAGEAPLAFRASFRPCAASETCDGFDDDCDGIVDNAIVPTGAFTPMIDAAGLAWDAVPEARTYDVVRGHFESSGLPPFSVPDIDACVASGETATTISFDLAPAGGEAWWFVARARNCGGAGSYDSGDAAQSGPRDAVIAASASSCP